MSSKLVSWDIETDPISPEWEALFTNKGPWKVLARYHRVVLKSGHIVEIGWSREMNSYAIKWHHPERAKDPENWVAEHKVYGRTVRDVINKTRREIAEDINPDLVKVRERVTGKDDSTLTFDKVKQMHKAMMLGTRYGAGSGKQLIVSRQAAEIIKEMNEKSGLRGLSLGQQILVDELAEPNSIFNIDDQMIDALKYSLGTTDKNPRK